MLDVMSQAKNAIEAYNEALRASSANIANMNVTGYKKVSVSFQSLYEKILSQGTAAYDSVGGTNPKQLGQGMGVSTVSLDFSAGEYITGSNLDLAISGQGLFVLSPDGGYSYRYTRAGNFEIDSSGNLTSNGMQVYGFDSSGNLVPITNLPSGVKTSYQWLADGTLQYTADGTTYSSTGYHIALTHFANPGGLAQGQGTTFVETPASGQAADPELPGSVVGTVKPGQLEQSNVFYLGESIAALEIQRAMNGNLTMVRMASDIINQFISRLSS
jgi:flagellar hook protein FlgE